MFYKSGPAEQLKPQYTDYKFTGPAHGSRSLFLVVNLDDGHTIGSETCRLLSFTCNRGSKTLSTGVLDKTYLAEKEEKLGMQAWGRQGVAEQGAKVFCQKAY